MVACLCHAGLPADPARTSRHSTPSWRVLPSPGRRVGAFCPRVVVPEPQDLPRHVDASQGAGALFSVHNPALQLVRSPDSAACAPRGRMLRHGQDRHHLRHLRRVPRRSPARHRAGGRARGPARRRRVRRCAQRAEEGPVAGVLTGRAARDRRGAEGGGRGVRGGVARAEARVHPRAPGGHPRHGRRLVGQVRRVQRHLRGALPPAHAVDLDHRYR